MVQERGPALRRRTLVHILLANSVRFKEFGELEAVRQAFAHLIRSLGRVGFFRRHGQFGRLGQLRTGRTASTASSTTSSSLDFVVVPTHVVVFRRRWRPGCLAGVVHEPVLAFVHVARIRVSIFKLQLEPSRIPRETKHTTYFTMRKSKHTHPAQSDVIFDSYRLAKSPTADSSIIFGSWRVSKQTLRCDEK